MFTGAPELGRALRAGIACSVGVPLQHVQLTSTVDRATGATVYFDEATPGNSGGGSCDEYVAAARRSLSRAVGQAGGGPVYYGDSGPDKGAHRGDPLQQEAAAPLLTARATGQHAAQPIIVSDITQLGPGRAIWYRDASAPAAAPLARGLQAASASAASTTIRIVIPPPPGGGSMAGIQARQQDAAQGIISALDESLSVEVVGGSSGLLDSLARTHFLDLYFNQTGINPEDLAAGLDVGVPLVAIPSVTGTGSVTPTLTPTSSRVRLDEPPHIHNSTPLLSVGAIVGIVLVVAGAAAAVLAAWWWLRGRTGQSGGKPGPAQVGEAAAASQIAAAATAAAAHVQLGSAVVAVTSSQGGSARSEATRGECSAPQPLVVV
jgi:hypothetical protein